MPLTIGKRERIGCEAIAFGNRKRRARIEPAAQQQHGFRLSARIVGPSKVSRTARVNCAARSFHRRRCDTHSTVMTTVFPRSCASSLLTAYVFLAGGVSACAPAKTPAPAPSPAAEPAIADGAGLLRAMHARYAGRWYSSIEIALNNTLFALDGRQTRSNWREFLGVPGSQRIDYLPLEQQSGVLYTGGRVYSFVNGKQNANQAGWNPLAVLVADVYAQPVDTTIRQLDSLGFDLSRVRLDFWLGDRVWVVGGPWATAPPANSGSMSTRWLSSV